MIDRSHDLPIAKQAKALGIIESGGDLLAIHGWKREREKAIFGHGGCGLDAIV